MTVVQFVYTLTYEMEDVLRLDLSNFDVVVVVIGINIIRRNTDYSNMHMFEMNITYLYDKIVALFFQCLTLWKQSGS